jgi:hypothetical protein
MKLLGFYAEITPSYVSGAVYSDKSESCTIFFKGGEHLVVPYYVLTIMCKHYNIEIPEFISRLMSGNITIISSDIKLLPTLSNKFI